MSSTSANASIPKTMKAEIIERYGAPEEVMHSAVVPVPEVGERDVLMNVSMAGVGVWEPAMCKGELGAEAGLPRILGADGAGTIAAVGSKVRRFHVGDRVFAYGFMNRKGGFYAEYAAVPEDEVARMPSTLSFEEAGALAADGLTALAGLDVLELRTGQDLMIFGASGGIGHLALELAKYMGARVLAIASGPDGVALVRRLGADEALDGRDEGVVEKARAFAANGIDGALVLASGADTLLELMKQGSRVAHPNGVNPPPREREGITLRAYDGYQDRAALERLRDLVAKGSLHVAVSKQYSLAETPKALMDVTRHHVGKLAVRVHA